MTNKNMYVNQLPKETQDKIISEITNMLYQDHLIIQGTIEYDETIDNAMNSKLSDLSDIIDITPYI